MEKSSLPLEPDHLFFSFRGPETSLSKLDYYQWSWMLGSEDLKNEVANIPSAGMPNPNLITLTCNACSLYESRRKSRDLSSREQVPISWCYKNRSRRQKRIKWYGSRPDAENNSTLPGRTVTTWQFFVREGRPSTATTNSDVLWNNCWL